MSSYLPDALSFLPFRSSFHVGNDLKDGSMAEIVAIVEDCRRLQVLNISENGFTSASRPALAQAVALHRRLKEVQ